MMFVTRREGLFFLFAGALLVVLAGCAASPERGNEFASSVNAGLEDRVQARWSYVIQRDFDAAYTFLTPEYRTVVPLQQYRGKFGGAVDWQVAHVRNVRYDSPTVASVQVEVHYRVGHPMLQDAKSEAHVRYLSEKWLHKDGVWWYTTEK